MPKWTANATKFIVSITHNVKRGTSYIPKPILTKLGNPEGLQFVMQGDKILVMRPDKWHVQIYPSSVRTFINHVFKRTPSSLMKITHQTLALIMLKNISMLSLEFTRRTA